MIIIVVDGKFIHYVIVPPSYMYVTDIINIYICGIPHIHFLYIFPSIRLYLRTFTS